MSDRPNKSFLRLKSDIPPEVEVQHPAWVADFGHFSPPYNPNNGLTRHDQQRQQRVCPFFAMPLFILAG